MVDLLNFKNYFEPGEMRIVTSSLASSNSCLSSSSLNTRQEERQQKNDELIRNIKQNYFKHRQADHFKFRRNLKISQVFPHFSELKPSSTITQSLCSSIEDDLNSTVLFNSNFNRCFVARKEKKQNLTDWNSDEISSSTSFIENIDYSNSNLYNCSTPCEYLKSNEIEQSYKTLKTHLEKIDSKLDNQSIDTKQSSYVNEKLLSLITNSDCEEQDFAQKQSNKTNSFSSSSQSSWASSSLTFSSMSSLDEKNYLNINSSQVETEKHDANPDEYLINKTESLCQIASDLDKERTILCKNDELIKQRFEVLKSRSPTSRTSNETFLKEKKDIEQKSSNISIVEYSYYPVHITIRINSNQNRTPKVEMPRSNSINRNKKLKFIYGQQSLDKDFYLDDDNPYGSLNGKNPNLYDSQRSTSSQNRVKFSDIIQMFDPNSLKKPNDQSNISTSNMSTETNNKPVIVFDDLKPSLKIDPILEDIEEKEVEQEKSNLSNFVSSPSSLQTETLSEQIKGINQTLNISSFKQTAEQKSVQTQTELTKNAVKSHDLDEKQHFYYETSVETYEDRQIFKFIPPNSNETQIKPVLLSQSNVITRKEKFEPVRRKVVEIKSTPTPLVTANVRQYSQDQVAPEEQKILVQNFQKETQQVDVNQNDSLNRSSNEIQIDIKLPPRSNSIQTASLHTEKEQRENVLTTGDDVSLNKDDNKNDATEEKVFKSDFQWTRRSSQIGETQYGMELNNIFKRLYNRHRDSVTSLTRSPSTSFDPKSTNVKTDSNVSNLPRYSRIGSLSKQYY